MEIKSSIRLYNTLSREIEEFIPLDDKKVGIYACGPTVYERAHIGHIRRYVLDDVLIRLLRYLSYGVTHVMNVTDVGHLVSDSDSGEDKMEKGARREKKTAWEVAKFYEEYFFQVMSEVGVARADIVCRATDHIKEQIELIKKLESKDFIYVVPDGVYFDSTKFPNYGKLARLDIDGLMAGARVEPVPGKKHATDFALWKFTPKDIKRDMEWDSPWGKGFPGWHIECSAMSMKYLGESFDIHTGGIDHIAIHHTNEIAQSEGATGKPFVKYWVHHNMLFVEGKKMSKSLGNFITLDEVKQKGYLPMALRYLFLQTHYRQEANFTWEALDAAQNALKQLRSQFTVLKNQSETRVRSQLSDEKLIRINTLRKKFKDVIRFDLNTPQALSIVWEMIKSSIPPSDKFDLLMIADDIMGLSLSSVTGEESQYPQISEEIKSLLNEREELRKQQKWVEADVIRKKIESMGWSVEDLPSGSQLKKI